MNSFKSACNFAKSTPVSFNQLQENAEPLLWGQVGVELIVSQLGVFKTAEHLSDSFHRATLAWRSGLHHRFALATSSHPRSACPRNRRSCDDLFKSG